MPMVQIDFGARGGLHRRHGRITNHDGLMVWALKKRIDARKKSKKNMTVCVRASWSSLPRVPGFYRSGRNSGPRHAAGRTNGYKKAALEYAADVKNKQKDLFTEQSIQNLFND